MDKLCMIRDIQRSVMNFESTFEKTYGICLNEGMTLCSLKDVSKLTAGELGELLGLTPSNTSKVIASLEKKMLIKRTLSASDKRSMFFSLTSKGKELLSTIKCDSLPMDATLKDLVCNE
jgi:MarR family transcriptional regulator, organic hydroperoxide resistance regulator